MAKAPRRRAGKVITMPTEESNVLAGNQSANLPDHDIAHRAFELYCERGCEHGHDIDDWLQAEREDLEREINVASGKPEPAPDSKPALPARFTRKSSGWK